jgi:hypothetical protein
MMKLLPAASFSVRFATVLGALFALAGIPSAQAHELLLVYWSASDCKWCAAWESPSPGMAQQLRKAREFKLITYREVKSARLAEPYQDEDFAGDIKWLKDRLDRGEEGPLGRPGWSFYVDKILVATFYGTKDWEAKNLPQIKQLVAHYSNPDVPVTPKARPAHSASF